MWECIRRALFVFSTRNPDTCLPHLCCILITSVLSYIWPRIMACIFLVVYLLGLVMGIALIVMICGLFVTGAIVFMALLMIFLAWHIDRTGQ